MLNKVKKLSDLITTCSNKFQFFERLGALDVYLSWASIVGEKIASHCKLIDIEKQIAVIETDHTGWSQYILLNKKRIIRNFQKKYPQLDVQNISVIVSATILNNSNEDTSLQKNILPVKKIAEYEGKLCAVETVKTELPIEICGLLEKLKNSIIENEK